MANDSGDGRPRPQLAKAIATIIGATGMIAGVVLIVAGALAKTIDTKTTVWAAAAAFLSIGFVVLNWGLGAEWPNGAAMILSRTVKRFPLTSACVGLVIVSAFWTSDVGPTDTPKAAGDIVLLHDVFGPAVVFQPPGHGIEYCSRKNEEWSTRWFGPTFYQDWPQLDQFTAFGSVYAGIEIVGGKGHELLFGYRDGDLRWHDPMPFGTVPTTGRPGFVQYQAPNSQSSEATTEFLAFAPSLTGGIRLFERSDYQHQWPPTWHDRRVIATELGHVNSVSAIVDDDERVILIVRVANHLFSLIRRPGGLPDYLANNWDPPAPLRTASGTELTVTGDPTVIRGGGLSVTSRLDVAAPGPQGVLLASTLNAAGAWKIEPPPPTGPVDGIAFIDGYTGGVRTFEIIYRKGFDLWHVWRQADQRWHQAASPALRLRGAATAVNPVVAGECRSASSAQRACWCYHLTELVSGRGVECRQAGASIVRAMAAEIGPVRRLKT